MDCRRINPILNVDCRLFKESVSAMQAAWDKLDRGETYCRWDCDFCNLQADINNAEVNLMISPRQAWYLREKYLRIAKG